MRHDTAPLRPAEFARAEYRRQVVRALAASGGSLSPTAALTADALAVTHQNTMRAPLSRTAREHFDAHAEAEGFPAFTDATLLAALLELEARQLLPTWCTFTAEGVAW